MSEVQELADRVASLLSVGDLDAAGRLVETFKTSQPAAYEIGFVALALHKRDPEMALLHARVAIENGAGAIGHQYLAMAHVLAGDPAAAIDASRRAVALDGSPRNRSALGGVLLAGGRPQDAAATLRQVTTESPKDRDALLNLGNAAAQLGDFGEAITSYARAFDTDPSDTRSIQNLIKMFAEVGRWLGAIAALELSRNKGEPPPEVNVALDVALLQLVRLVAERFPPPSIGEDADKAVRSVIASALTRGTNVQLAVARMLVDLGRNAEAQTLLDQIERQPLATTDRAVALYLRGVFAHAAKDSARAGELYREALAIDPNRTDAAVNATQLALEDGTPAALERIPAIVEAVPAEHRTPELLFNHAAYLARNGRRDESRGLLERVIRVTGGSSRIGQLARKALAELGAR